MSIRVYRFCPLFWLALSIVASFTSFAQSTGRLETSRILHIKVTSETAKKLPVKSTRGRLGYVVTGVSDLDKANLKHKAVSFRRLYRPAGRFELAHKKYGLDLWYEAVFEESVDQSLLEDYRKIQSFRVVEQPKPYYSIGTHAVAASNTSSNDPSFFTQWHFKNTGQTGGLPGADISLEKAWTIETGSPDVIVAVIDGGIDLGHPDLQPSIWSNQGEIAANGLDDDGNGYIDDSRGYNFGDNTRLIYPDNHGTHVAGTIGAVSNNGIGVAGIAGGSGTGDGVRLMSCAVFGELSNGGFEEAFVYAADNGAVIAQNSWNGGSSAIEAAIDYFIARAGLDNTNENFSQNIQVGPLAGGIVFFAAGNSNSSFPTSGYPSSYQKVIAVAATDDQDQKSTFSNYGTWVDISAPGTSVFSTFPTSRGSYAYLSGTSMACPHVSGVAALIVSKYGGAGTTPDVIWQRIRLGATNIHNQNPLLIGRLGAGRLNAYHALVENPLSNPSAITDLRITALTNNTVTLQWTSPPGSVPEIEPATYDLRVSTQLITAQNFSAAQPIAGLQRPKPVGTNESFVYTRTLPASTKLYFALRSSDMFGNTSTISNVISTSQFNKPILEINPAIVEANLFAGNSLNIPITISNQGVGSLTVTIKEENVTPIFASASRIQSMVTQSNKIIKQTSNPYVNPDLPNHEFVPKTRVPKVASTTNPQSGAKLFAIDRESDNILVMNGTGAVLQTLPLPEPKSNGPDGLAFDGHSIFFVNGFSPSKKIYQLNAETGEVLGEMNYPEERQLDALAHSGKYLYGLDFVSNEILEIDFSNLSVRQVISPPFAIGGGLSFGGKRNSLFISSFENQIHEWDLRNQSIKSSFQLDGLVYGLAYSAATNSLYVANATTGELEVYSPDTWMLGNVIEAYHLSALASDEHGEYPWLQLEASEYQVAADQELVIPLTLSAEHTPPGNYTQQLVINSNDPEKPEVTLAINLTIAGAPNLVVDPASLAFPDAYVGHIMKRPIRLSNNGSEALTISNITSTNPHFSISETAFTIDAGGLKVIDVTLLATEPSQAEGMLEIISNDPETPVTTVALSASAMPPPVIAGSNSDFTFHLLTGETSALPFTIQNNGGSDLTYTARVRNIVANQASEMAQAEDFAKVGLYTANAYTFTSELNKYSSHVQHLSLPVSESTIKGFDILVIGNSFQEATPTDIGIVRSWLESGGNLLLFSDQPGLGLKVNELLAGMAVSQIEVESRNGPFTQIVAHVTTEAVDALDAFGSAAAFQTTEPTNVLVEAETGAFALFTQVGRGKVIAVAGDLTNDLNFIKANNRTFIFNVIEWLGMPVGWLTLNNANGLVGATQSTDLLVEANATRLEPGTYESSFEISNNDPTQPVLEVNVSLEVSAAPDLLATPSVINYGNTFVGGQKSLVLTVENIGTLPLSITSLESGTSEFVLSNISVPLTLQPGEELLVPVTFIPTMLGAKPGLITIESNDPFNAITEIQLSGVGVPPPIIQVSPPSSPKQLMPEASGSALFTIKNAGGSQLSWSAAISYPVSSGFNWLKVNSPQGLVNTNTSQTVAITFSTKGLELGSYEATMTISSNDPLNPLLEVPVSLEVLAFSNPNLTEFLPSQLLEVNEEAVIDLANFFVDPDGHKIRFVAVGSKANVSLAIDDPLLVVKGITAGTTTVFVEASDSFGGYTSTSFEVGIKNPNHPPVIRADIPDITLETGSTQSLDLANYFEDPDGDEMTFSASVENSNLVLPSLVGTTLNMQAKNLGNTEILVTATDLSGDLITQSFKVSVVEENLSPIQIKPFDPIEIELPGNAAVLDLADYFSDPNGDPLLFVAKATDESILSTRITGGTLTITPLKPGVTSITVTVVDSFENAISATLAITLFSNSAPNVRQPIADQEVEISEVPIQLTLSDFFEDRDGDELSYQVVLTNPEIFSTQLTGSALSLSPKNIGQTIITLAATDPRGLSISTQATFKVIRTTGLEESEDTILQFYPNPFRDKLVFRFTPSSNGSARFVISDLLGHRILQETTPCRKDSPQEYIWDSSNVPPGIYLIHFQMGGKFFVEKVRKLEGD